METEVTYADVTKEDFIDSPLWWQKQGLMETATGYGSKLTTRYKVQYEGKLRRVYAICHSNCSSLFINVKKQKLFIGS